MDDDELLDLVDSRDRVIGTILRSRKHDLEPQQFLRAAELFIQNRHGQLWVPRRQKHKTIAPGGLDFSASGHVAAGESYLKALEREVKEELNLEINHEQLKLIHKFPPTGAERLFFRSVYLYTTDETPSYNPQDFSSYEWLRPEELLKLLRNGEPAKRSLLETVAYIIEHTD